MRSVFDFASELPNAASGGYTTENGGKAVTRKRTYCPGAVVNTGMSQHGARVLTTQNRGRRTASHGLCGFYHRLITKLVKRAPWTLGAPTTEAGEM
jgi:hypothetical protein